MLTKKESQQRIVRLQKELKTKGLHGALLVYPVDIYYYSGTRQNSLLWIPALGHPLLLVRKSFSRARAESVIDDTRPLPSSRELPALFDQEVKRVGFTFDVVPVQQLQYFAKLLPGWEFVDISALYRELRSLKSPWELRRMRNSAARLCEVFSEVPYFLEEGVRELDLAAEFECRLRKTGGEGYVRMRAFNQELFLGVALSSDTAVSPGCFDGSVTGRGLSNASPHGASTARIRANTPVLIDYTGVFNGYIADMTRMFVIGTLAPELEDAFAVSLAIQSYLVDNLKPGAVCEELYAKALEMAEAAGLAQNFLGAPGENSRFVGHGIGLELDEFPVLAQGFTSTLKAGQTIAIEPKFVLPGHGVIGIENTYVVSSRGGVKITDLPDEIVYL